MINSHHKHRGAVTLIFTVILLVLSTMIILFAANFGQMQSKVTANLHRNRQAFAAAEAGMEFGINYLLQNRATVTASASSGSINYSDSSMTNVTLANNSKFTVVFTNPTVNDYDLMLITSTGSSDDSSSTRVVKQLVKFGSLFKSVPSNPITGLKDIDLSGNSTIINLESNITLVSGGHVDLSGSSYTVLSSGVSSTPSHTGSDIKEEANGIHDQSQSDFFSNYFGVSEDTVKSNVTTYYSNSSTTNYSSTLNGLTGVTIWIDQSGGEAVLNGNVTIGSPDNPVMLFVDGSLKLSGNLTFYGLIYSTKTSTQDISGNIVLNGAFISAGKLNIKGNSQINYSSSILQGVQSQPYLGYFAKIPGSWSDF